MNMMKQDKLLLGTNTKMYKTVRQTVEFLTELQQLTSELGREDMELFVIPSYTSLESANRCTDPALIRLGAQNMGWEDEGQFSGEISPLMLRELGISTVMIGHSERRHVFLETDEMENKKVLCALRHGLIPLLCVGETAEEKAAGRSDEVLRRQLEKGLDGVQIEDVKLLRIAYEPVWAIGVGGVPASKEYACEKHGFIRQVLCELFGDCAAHIPLLYGGSVNPENAPELIMMENIDGLFIGRSAWLADKFNTIIRTVLPLWMAK